MGRFGGGALAQRKPRSLSRNLPEINESQNFNQSFAAGSLRLIPIQNQRQHSRTIFEGSKIETCSQFDKVGTQIVALPYYMRPQQIMSKTLNSGQFTTEFRQNFSQHPNQHVGMNKKPLTRYDPNSLRSRVQYNEQFKPQLPNRSQFQLGEKQVSYKDQWQTTQRHHFVKQNYKIDPNQKNPAILAFKAQWSHNH